MQALALAPSPIAPAFALDGWPVDRVQLENSSDVTSIGTLSTDLTLTVSPLGVYYESGPRVRVTGSWSRYSYWGDAQQTIKYTGTDRQGDFLLGYAWAFERASVMGAIGPSLVYSVQRPTQGVAKQINRRGLTLYGATFGNPTQSTMAYAQARYSTISKSYLVQAKTGVAIGPGLYAGPEVTYTGGTRGFAHFRLGAHITGVKMGPALLGLSSGFVRDRHLGSGIYGGSFLMVNF